MVTLVFLICFPSGACIQQAPGVVFQNHTQCEVMAEITHSSVQSLVANGEMEPHVAIHKCLDWGVPS